MMGTIRNTALCLPALKALTIALRLIAFQMISPYVHLSVMTLSIDQLRRLTQ